MKFTAIVLVAATMVLASASNGSGNAFSNAFHRTHHRIHNSLVRSHADAVRRERAYHAGHNGYYGHGGYYGHDGYYGHHYGSVHYPYH